MPCFFRFLSMLIAIVVQLNLVRGKSVDFAIRQNGDAIAYIHHSAEIADQADESVIPARQKRAFVDGPDIVWTVRVDLQPESDEEEESDSEEEDDTPVIGQETETTKPPFRFFLGESHVSTAINNVPVAFETVPSSVPFILTQTTEPSTTVLSSTAITRAFAPTVSEKAETGTENTKFFPATTDFFDQPAAVAVETAAPQQSSTIEVTASAPSSPRTESFAATEVQRREESVESSSTTSLPETFSDSVQQQPSVLGPAPAATAIRSPEEPSPAPEPNP